MFQILQNLKQPKIVLKTKSKRVLVILAILLLSFTSNNIHGQNIYTNDMDYVLGDVKQLFITDAISTTAQVDNLLKGFKYMKVNGIRIPIFPEGTEPNKAMIDYFYEQAVAQGFPLFANPAQSSGAKNLACQGFGVNCTTRNIPARTNILIDRVKQFANEYKCKWISPFNEDGKTTDGWTAAQMNTIYSSLYNDVNGAELIGPCVWGIPASIEVYSNTNISNYITVATTHNLGFNHAYWPDFIALADTDNLPVWDSEVNNNDKFGTGTRLEVALANQVDGLVLYNSGNGINLTSGSVSAGNEAIMALYLKPVVNLALAGTATQSSTDSRYNATANLAIDDDLNGNFGGGSVTHTNSELNPWWQVDLGSDTAIGEIKVFNRTDGCCKARMSNFTVSVINSSGTEAFSQTFTTFPDPSVLVDAGGAVGSIVKIQLNATNALTIAEVQVFAPAQSLSVNTYEAVNVSVAPNPFSDHLRIVSPHAVINNYTIYNMNGQKLLNKEVKSGFNSIQINTSSLSTGLYFIKLNGDNFSKSYKVLKN